MKYYNLARTHTVPLRSWPTDQGPVEREKFLQEITTNFHGCSADSPRMFEPSMSIDHQELLVSSVLKLRVYVCIYIYVCVYVYIHTCIYTQTVLCIFTNCRSVLFRNSMHCLGWPKKMTPALPTVWSEPVGVWNEGSLWLFNAKQLVSVFSSLAKLRFLTQRDVEERPQQQVLIDGV